MKSKEQVQLNSISRRDFLRFAALGAGTMVAISVAGQASAAISAPLTPSAPGVAPTGKKLSAVISRNHGHSFLVPLDQFLKAGPKSYNIQGTAGHPHMMNVTADVLKALLAVKAVEIESTNVAGHTHIIRLQIV